MAKQSVKVEIFYGGSWHDLVASDQVLESGPIVISRGDTDESQAPKPSQISLRLKNDDDSFRTSNPLSPLYGKAGLNTPIRVSVGSNIRGYGEASSWSADQTPDFRRSPLRGSAWVDVQAGGLLRRIGQWSRAVTSPLTLFDNDLTTLVGRWRMEDAAGSTVATSSVPGASNVLLRGHSFGSQNSPPGGGTAVDVGTNPRATFVFAPSDPASTAGWQASRVMYIDRFTGGGIADPVMAVNVKAGESNRLFQIAGDTGTITLQGFGGDGHTFTQDFVSGGYNFTGKWIMFQFQETYSGGTTTLGASWRAIGDSGWLGVSTTYTGLPSVPYFTASALLPGCSYGHYVVASGFTEDLTSDARFDAFSGHPGETAAEQFLRLCDENNIPRYVGTRYPESQLMGPQGGTLPLSKLFEIEQTTDDGLIYDHRTEGKIFFMGVADRLNQTPALTLDAHANPTGMPSLPAEVTDDLPVNNIVTAKQQGGGEFTARDDTSSMGTQDPPNGRGEYKQDVNVSVADPASKLPQQAHWWLRRGTVDLPRFPTITVDLDALRGNAAQVAAVEAVDVGSVIQIVNYREYTIRLYVLGYRETIGTHSRSITFTCAPDQQFKTGVLNGPGRLQANSTVINGSITATATTLVLMSIDPLEAWRPGVSTAHILVEGEEIALGTIGAPGAGPLPPFIVWTVTGCTRSVNGIVKAHGGANPVKVKDPIRLTLGEAS